jgi:hypothetical protein
MLVNEIEDAIDGGAATTKTEDDRSGIAGI